MLSNLKHTGNLLPSFRNKINEVEDDYRELLENYRQQQMKAPKDPLDIQDNIEFDDFLTQDTYSLQYKPHTNSDSVDFRLLVQ
jgi:hypothetical protein